MIRTPAAVAIHTDGSCLGNPGPGGWAARLAFGSSVRFLSGGFARTTNNRMELYAAIMSLEALTRSCPVLLYTDSRYLHDAVVKGWLAAWRKNGWKRADKKGVLNKDLWERLARQLARHSVSLRWVAGHSGQRENEAVDALARQAAALPALPADAGFEE
ncbi:MAG: ribonuclease HI [Desulfovibrio sp.]|jgi:ribonuclease HI|nr:ribonuclease HI [Desulfovibrio sp.]